MAKKSKMGTLIKVATAVAPFVYDYYKKKQGKERSLKKEITTV